MKTIIDKSSLIIIVLLLIMFGLGICVGVLLQMQKTEAQITELKEKDEDIFNTYRDGIDLAADSLACFGNELCLQDKSNQLDELAVKIKEQLNARESKYGAER